MNGVGLLQALGHILEHVLIAEVGQFDLQRGILPGVGAVGSILRK